MAKFLFGFLTGVLTLPIAILTVARLGLLPIRANTSPSGWEGTLANMALSASAARQAPHVPNPVAPTEENLMAGMKLFKDDCAGCHGDPNRPNSEAETGLYPNAQAFAFHPPRMPDYQLFWIISNGVRYS